MAIRHACRPMPCWGLIWVADCLLKTEGGVTPTKSSAESQNQKWDCDLACCPTEGGSNEGQGIEVVSRKRILFSKDLQLVPVSGVNVLCNPLDEGEDIRIASLLAAMRVLPSGIAHIQNDRLLKNAGIRLFCLDFEMVLRRPAKLLVTLSRLHKTSDQVGFMRQHRVGHPNEEVRLTYVNHPSPLGRNPSARKYPSLESESLSGTVGPLPLLDTLSALPLPACSYGPLHRLQEDSGLPPALGKRRRPHEGCPCGQSRDQCVLTQLQASRGLPRLNKRPAQANSALQPTLLGISNKPRLVTGEFTSHHPEGDGGYFPDALAGHRGVATVGLHLRTSPGQRARISGAHCSWGTLGLVHRRGVQRILRRSYFNAGGTIEFLGLRQRWHIKVECAVEKGREKTLRTPGGNGGNGKGGNEHLHREQPDGASRLLAKGGVWIEGTTEDREPSDHALNGLKNADTRWEGGNNEHSHRGNQTARRGCS
ncbi:hypothetical protein H4582DRAFT_2059328 [Lactarius indigo]|nr:hypothetical protein H4582DRAFT_2059328 [Lactarius indigo]